MRMTEMNRRNIRSKHLESVENLLRKKRIERWVYLNSEDRCGELFEVRENFTKVFLINNIINILVDNRTLPTLGTPFFNFTITIASWTFNFSFSSHCTYYFYQLCGNFFNAGNFFVLFWGSLCGRVFIEFCLVVLYLNFFVSFEMWVKSVYLWKFGVGWFAWCRFLAV